jgi:hypothetical protein
MQAVKPFRAASMIAMTFALVLSAHPTLGAKRPPVEQVSAGDRCGVSVSVIRWTPDSGPPARFIADMFTAHGTGLFIALGHADDAFWSVEGYWPSDACDDCNVLDLVGTSLKDGKRRVSPLLSQKDHELLFGKTDAEIHDYILGKLFRLAQSGAWPAGDLAHDYVLRLPARDTQGAAKDYQGWLVEVGKPKQWRLLFDLDSDPHMCWCLYHWVPKKVEAK